MQKEKNNRRALQKKKARFFNLKSVLKSKYTSIIPLQVENFKFYKELTSYHCYNIDGGLPVTDFLIKNSKKANRSIISEFNIFKKIVSVTLDDELSIFSIGLDYTPCNRAPMELLLSRLQSMNNKEAYQLVQNLNIQNKLIQDFKSEHASPSSKERSFLVFDPFQLPPSTDQDYKKHNIAIQKACEKYKDFPFLAYRSRKNNLTNQIALVELEISENFVGILGYEENTFIQRILKRGLPPLFNDKNDIQGLNEIVRGIIGYNLKKEIEIKYEIKSEKYGIFPAVSKKEYVYFMKGDFLEFFTIEYFIIDEIYKKRIEQEKNEEKSNDSISNLRSRNASSSLIVEKLPFRDDSIRMLKTYYPEIKISEEKLTDIFRCGFKNI